MVCYANLFLYKLQHIRNYSEKFYFRFIAGRNYLSVLIYFRCRQCPFVHFPVRRQWQLIQANKISRNHKIRQLCSQMVFQFFNVPFDISYYISTQT
ncbi:hypothetical protein D3C74_252300 [compost metagenome]